MIAFRSFTQTIVSTNGSNTITVSYPAGILAGDALVLCIINTNPTTQTTPTGWSAPVQSNANVNGNLAAYVWEKTAVGTESGTVSSTLGVGSSGIGVMLRYTNTLITGPFGTTISTNSGATNSTSSTAAGTLSPAPGGADLVVRFYTFAQNGLTATGLTMTNPGGTWTTRGNLVSVGTTSIFANGLVFADKVAGTDNQTVSTNSQTGAWMVIDVDLKMAAIQAPLTNRARLVRASHW